MTEKSVTKKISTGEVAQNSLSKDEIDELSGLISDCMSNETLDGEDTGSSNAAKDDDTGEFKPVDGSE